MRRPVRPPAREVPALRARDPVVGEPDTAEGGHAFAVTVGMCAVAIVAALGWPLITSSSTSAAASVASAPAPTPIRLFRTNDAAALRPAAKVPTEVPFVDSPAAGRRDYAEGDYENALRQFRMQIELEPANAEPYSNAGQVLVRMGQTTEAMPLLQKAVELDPERWAYRFNLARAEGLMGQWDKAALDYAEASKLFPNDYATLFNLGQALHRAGREEEAVAQYRQAIQQRPEDPTFYLALGASEDKLGHASEAAAAYRQYVSMDPSARHAAAITARASTLDPASARSEQGGQ